MSKEKQSDSVHWKNKLENATGLQEHLPLDKNAAWEKLQYRLHKKPVRYARAWYRVAAVVLVLFAIPFLMKKNNPFPVFTTKAIDHKSVEALNNKSTNEKISESILNTARAGKEKSIVIVKNKHPHQNYTSSPSLVKPAIIYTTLPEKTSDDINIASIRSMDTTKTIPLIAVTTKKKLKMVHINELEPPIDQMALIKSHNGSYSDIKFANRMMNNTAPVVQSYEYTSIFKIKF